MIRCIACKLVARDDAGECLRCGGTDFVRSEGEVISNRYAIERRLGAGGMGTVYLAHDVDLGREIALKLVGKTIASSARDLLRREAAALAAIRDPHVVQVHDFGAQGERYYIAMEYVRGRTLEELLDDYRLHHAFVPLDRVTTIVRQVAAGLAAAHAAGIVHRDVKPANIVIEAGSGRPVVVDFGLARRLVLPAGSHVVGTPAYMAPEQALVGATDVAPVGPATDVYSLACTAFELLTNRPPFDGADVQELLRKHALEEPPRLSSLRPELAPLDVVIARALAKQPGARYAGCLELRAAFKEAVAGLLAPAPGPKRPSSPVEQPGALRVLVVDDDEAFRRFAARATQLAMPKVLLSISAVGSGAEAADSARRTPPRLLILDYDLPGLDGLATLSQLRALPKGGEARVLVVSARVHDTERWKFGVLGVSDFLAKPVQLPELVQAIDAMASRSGWVKPHRTVSL